MNCMQKETNKKTKTQNIGQSYFDCSHESCNQYIMKCGNNDHCYVDCSYPMEACQDAIIHCPTTPEYECIVECNGIESCDRVKIYGQHSKVLTVACGDYDESCQDIDVYCPMNLANGLASPSYFRNIPTCFISGHNGM